MQVESPKPSRHPLNQSKSFVSYFQLTSAPPLWHVLSWSLSFIIHHHSPIIIHRSSIIDHRSSIIDHRSSVFVQWFPIENLLAKKRSPAGCIESSSPAKPPTPRVRRHDENPRSGHGTHDPCRGLRSLRLTQPMRMIDNHLGMDTWTGAHSDSLKAGCFGG